MAVVGLLFITTSMLSCVVREDKVSVKYALQTKNEQLPYHITRFFDDETSW